MERDAGLFGDDLDGADVADCADDGVEECANFWGLSGEVMREIMATAGV